MADDRLKAFYDKEVNEIMQNKLRFGAIIASLAISLAIFTFTDGEAEMTSATDIKSSKVVTSSDESEINKNSESSSRVTKIIGLERAAEGVELINPFKSDLVNPPAEVNPPVPSEIPLPQPTKSDIIKPIKTDDEVVLTLKGTAISGNKKMAIIQYSVISKNNSKESRTSKDKNKCESLLLSIGDEIEGRRIVAISRNFITFDDGEHLYLQEGS